MKVKFLFLTIVFMFSVPALPAQDLINAVKNGSMEQLQKLLPYDNMDEMDENNFTAYHWTAILGDKKMAELLLENGADPRILVTDIPYKKTSMGEIIWGGKIIGARSAAVLAEEYGNNDLIDFYISQGGIDYNLRSAVMCGNKVVTEKCLKAGGNPNMIINLGGTMLVESAIELSLESGSDDMIDILVKNGADISKAFASSFLYGRTNRDSQIWEKMIQKGAKIDQTFHDYNFNTTLLSFAWKNDGGKLKFLVNHGADLTVQDEKGRTLLHYSVEAQGNVANLIPPDDVCDKACKIKYLSIRDNNGQTACDIAKERYKHLKETDKSEYVGYRLEHSQGIIDLVCYDEVEKQVLNRLSK